MGKLKDNFGKVSVVFWLILTAASLTYTLSCSAMLCGLNGVIIFFGGAILYTCFAIALMFEKIANQKNQSVISSSAKIKNVMLVTTLTLMVTFFLLSGASVSSTFYDRVLLVLLAIFLLILIFWNDK